MHKDCSIPSYEIFILPATIECSKILSFLCAFSKWKGVFFVTKLKELIQGFKLNQEVLGRVKRYIDVSMFRLYCWEGFMRKN